MGFPRPLLLAPLLGCLIGGAAACARPAPEAPRPEDTLRAYVRAVRAGDARTAYALLAPETRAEVPFDAFADKMRENRKELEAQTEALERRAEQGIRPRARAHLAGSRSLVLVRERGRWRVEAGVAETPSLHTPRDAVLALRRALAGRDLRGVERVLSRETRAELEADIRRFLDETADPLDLEYEVQGDRARVRTTAGREVHLVREAGEWRVVDVEEPSD
ncbi:MAG: hypothetical protein ACODAU_07325 [Myxococcota bacterium]